MKYLVTGATGWVGQSILHELQRNIPSKEFNKKVISFASKEGFLESTFYKNKILVPIYNLSDIKSFAKKDEKLNLIHTAFLTKDRIKEYGLNEFIKINQLITKNICDFLKEFKVYKVILISSGAASTFDYKKSKEEVNFNIYGHLKKLEENKIIAHCDNFLILRIYALTGRFIRDPLNFAIGDFLINAIKNEPIKISSSNKVIRSYVNASDLSKLCYKWINQELITSNLIINAISETIDLIKLATIITEMYNLKPINCNIDKNLRANNYSASNKDFLKLINKFKIKPKNIYEQIKDTSLGIKKIHY